MKKFASYLSLLAAIFVSMVPATVEADPRSKTPRFRHHFPHRPGGIFGNTFQYRPKVKIIQPATAFQASGKTKVTVEFSVRQGSVSHLEFRIDGKKVTTVKTPANAKSGRLQTTVNLSGVPRGNHKLQVWAWQGRLGKQRLHGESKKISFTR